MATLKELRKKVSIVAKRLRINEELVEAAIDLVERGKVPKSQKLFKDLTPKISKTEWYRFMVLDMGKNKYFFMGDIFPLDKKELTTLKKTPIKQEEELELVNAFYDVLEKIKPKGFITGEMKYVGEQANEEEGKEYIMGIKERSLDANGILTKKNFLETIENELDHELLTQKKITILVQIGNSVESVKKTTSKPDTDTGSTQFVTNSAGEITALVNSKNGSRFELLKPIPPKDLKNANYATIGEGKNLHVIKLELNNKKLSFTALKASPVPKEPRAVFYMDGDRPVLYRLDNSFSENAEGLYNAIMKLDNEQGKAIKRRLDALGVHDNRLEVLLMNGAHQNALVKTEGDTRRLDLGVYLSDKDDTYGDFKFITGLAAEKYETNRVIQIHFKSAEQINTLSNYYKELPIPGFLMDFFLGQEGRDLSIYNANQNAYSYVKPLTSNQNGFMITPNTPYKSSKDAYHDLKNHKNTRDGIALLAWAINPYIDAPILNEIRAKSGVSQQEKSSKTPTIEELKGDQAAISQKTGVKALTTIMDFDKTDLPMLKDLKNRSLEYLKAAYDVNESTDNVLMFFHYPVAGKTGTLHLHIWVNRAEHPLMYQRSNHLDDIIAHLEAGHDIKDLVLNRNGGNINVPAVQMVAERKKGVVNFDEVENSEKLFKNADKNKY